MHTGSRGQGGEESKQTHVARIFVGKSRGQVAAPAARDGAAPGPRLLPNLPGAALFLPWLTGLCCGDPPRDPPYLACTATHWIRSLPEEDCIRRRPRAIFPTDSPCSCHPSSPLQFTGNAPAGRSSADIISTTINPNLSSVPNLIPCTSQQNCKRSSACLPFDWSLSAALRSPNRHRRRPRSPGQRHVV